MMKLLMAFMALTIAASALPLSATEVGVSITVGEPGFYGHLEIGTLDRPRLVYAQPILVERRYRALAPVYLHVPPGHAKNWRRYCARYDACLRPVYFVRSDWYETVYAPKYRKAHGQERREERREDREERREDRRESGRENGKSRNNH
jgi:hypothetical protein